MRVRDISTGVAIAALTLSGSSALATEVSSQQDAVITVTKQPKKVRPNSRFRISGFVGSRPRDPTNGTVTLTAIRGHGKRPTVTVAIDSRANFSARVKAGNGKTVQYRLTFKSAGWRADPVKTRRIEVSK